MDFAQHIAEDAITLVRDNGQVLPLPKLLPPVTESETILGEVEPAAAGGRRDHH